MYLQKNLGETLSANGPAVAIEENGKAISYSELMGQAEKVSAYLLANGFRQGARVGICVDTVTEMVVCMIGAVQAGCVFVPIDGSLPENRLKLIVHKSRPNAIIVSDGGPGEQKAGSIRQIKLTDILERPAVSGGAAFPDYQEDDDLYIYFTSGSTGEPKGIVGKNSSLWHFLEWERETFNIKPGQRFSQLISPYFDAFLRDIFIPLTTGGTICVPPRKEGLFIPERLVQWVDEQQINFIHCVPSVFRLLNNKGISSYNYEKLEYVLLSGERIVPSELINWYDTFGSRIQLANLYGSTEATMISCWHLIQPQDALKSKIPIGGPIADAELVIMDKNQRPCKPLIAGEIYIISDYLSNGYLNEMALTKEKFIELDGENGKRMAFRTGDSARILADGSIDLLGREDRLIKLRGIRIELDEIERIVRNCPLVQSGVVLHDKNTDSLLAFVTPAEMENRNQENLIPQIEEYLAGQLPGYMIPARICMIDAMPLLSTGKVDYNQLLKKSEEVQELVLPANETEERVLVLWKEILQTDQVSVDKNFQAAGGNSLSIMRLMTRIFAEFNIRVSLAELFANLTIQKQATLIQSKLDDITVSEVAEQIEKSAVRSYYPLSSTQRRLYFLYKLNPEALAYNLPQVVELEGNVDKDKVEETFRKLIDRHESLRTSFVTVEEDVFQRVSEDVQFSVEYSELGKGDSRTVIEQFIRPFDLSQAPLIRVGLVKRGAGSYLLLVDVHHIITDGVSQGILTRDFMALYNNEELPEVKVQYKDYSEWQQAPERQERLAAQRDFWKREFEGEISVLDLPVDHQRPAVKSYAGSSLSFSLSREETNELKALGDQSGATLFMTLLSVFNILLSKLSNQEDITIGTAIAGRYREDLERTIGVFVNTLALRNYPEGGITFQEFLLQVKQKSLACFENQQYAYEDLIGDLQVERDVSRNPLFDVMFSFHNFEQEELVIPGLRLHLYDNGFHISKFDLLLAAVETAGALHLKFEYSTELFEAKTVERFIGYFKRIVTAITGNGDIRLSGIDILSKEERHTLLDSFNDTASAYPRDKTILHLFEEQAARTPDHVAVRCGDHVLTYRQLKERADRMAGYLQQEYGVKKGDLVGLLLEREEELFPCIFGILRAGAVYVPLSTGYPPARLNMIRADSGISVLITRKRFIDALSVVMGAGLLDLDAALETIQERPLPVLTTGPAGGDLAYVIYTSGSTGKPKGVMIEHHSIVNRLLWMQKEYVLTEKDVLLQKTPLVFDVSVWELFWWSFTGASVCLLPPEGEKDPRKIVAEIEKNGVTTLHFVPSMLSAFLDGVEGGLEGQLSSLRQVFASGEALGANHVNRFGKTLYATYGTRLINLYGPTEATVDVSYYECDFSKDNEVIPIGKPIDNTRLYVLDRNAGLTPLGVAGELCIGGVGLARGYLNNEALTSEKFITATVGREERLYRTGDLACWLPDGNIRYLGRMDHQVKIRGYRIEPGEIEVRLMSYENVKQAVVLCMETGNDKKLAAFLVAETDAVLNTLDVRQFLKNELPDHMIPALIRKVDEIPLTSNGKIDRKRILALIDKSVLDKSSFIKPATEIEISVAKIWSDFLTIEEIGLDDNFFDLGGHSILLLRVSSALNEKYGIDIPLNVYFSNTLGQICKEIEAKLKELQELQELQGLQELEPGNIE